jgi:hypothetical protein
MPAQFKFEYVTSTVSLLKTGGQGDGIVVHVLNDANVKAKTHVTIYQNTGAGAVAAYDSGDVDVVKSWTWTLGFTITGSGEYWVRIKVSSENLIPKASYERVQNSVWIPIVSYKPGDFAVFQLTPARTRIW